MVDKLTTNGTPNTCFTESYARIVDINKIDYYKVNIILYY